MKYCPNCGEPAEDHALVCIKCRYVFNHKKPAYCMACGKKLEPDEIYCRYCGRKITSIQEQVDEAMHVTEYDKNPDLYDRYKKLAEEINLLKISEKIR